MIRFNPPPGWPPIPDGWTPPVGWTVPEGWPDAPDGWNWYVDDAAATPPPAPFIAPPPAPQMPASPDVWAAPEAPIPRLGSTAAGPIFDPTVTTGTGYNYAPVPDAGRNVFIWLMATVYPVLYAIITFGRAVTLSRPFSAVGTLILVAAYAATVVFAYQDYRRQRDAGYWKSPHWAWAFLPPVYLIWRRISTHENPMPVVTYLGVIVAGFALGVVGILASPANDGTGRIVPSPGNGDGVVTESEALQDLEDMWQRTNLTDQQTLCATYRSQPSLLWQRTQTTSNFGSGLTPRVFNQFFTDKCGAPNSGPSPTLTPNGA